MKWFVVPGANLVITRRTPDLPWWTTTVMSSQNTVSNKRKQTSPQRTPELVSKRRRTGGVDALELLRKYVSRKIPITREGNHLHFGNRKFHIKTPTRIKKKDSGQHYDLGTVWFLVCGGVSLSEYLKGAKQGGVDTINFADREAVKNYITGELETIPQLDTAAIRDIAGQHFACCVAGNYS